VFFSSFFSVLINFKSKADLLYQLLDSRGIEHPSSPQGVQVEYGEKVRLNFVARQSSSGAPSSHEEVRVAWASQAGPAYQPEHGHVYQPRQ